MIGSAAGSERDTFTPARVNSLEETGLEIGVVADLALKILHSGGVTTGAGLANALRLPYLSVVDAVTTLLKQRHYVEVTGSSSPLPQDFEYALSERGEQKVTELLRHSTYHGPCPVTVAQYSATVARQSVRSVQVTLSALEEALQPLVLGQSLLYQLGPAINSGTAIFLFGPPGNGKTAIAELAVGSLSGHVSIPHALYVDGQIIQVFDEIVHHPLPMAEDAALDERWVTCRRPLIVVGGELTMAALDLTWSEETKAYQAPLQVKANGGLLLVDDFGRQQITPAALLNRWIIPLARGVDYLSMSTGSTLKVPFDPLLVFATNLDPRGLADEAFLRRIRYKIMVPSPTPEQFREIFRRAALERRIPYSDEAVDYLLTFYQRSALVPRACHPGDLLDQLRDHASFLGTRTELTPQLLDIVLQSYFMPPSAPAPARNSAVPRRGTRGGAVPAAPPA